MRAALSLVAAVALAAVAAPASAAPDHAEIAFVGGNSIWAARADGSERRLLLRPGPREAISDPAWSHDGSTLAYVSGVAPPGEHGTENGAARLRLFDGVANRPLTPLRKGVYDLSPAWSPDGTTLAFQRIVFAGERIRSEIVTRVLATGAERTLVRIWYGRKGNTVGEPAWSPDGSTIAYTHSRFDADIDSRPLIRTLPAAGGKPRTLIRDAHSPAWSPDGTRLAFSSIRDRNGKRCGSDQCSYAAELYTAAADGGDLRRLTTNEGADVAPKWSPDGSRLLFTSDRNLPEGNSSEVYSIAADGSCLIWLTNGTPGSALAAWRPRSGRDFAPGSCDPATRPALVDTPRLPDVRDGLWLGPRFDGLLLSSVQRQGRYTTLNYDDCAHFDPRRCPQPVLLSSQHVCDSITFRSLSENTYRLLQRRGALLAYYSEQAGSTLLSGRALTSIQLTRNRLTDVERIVRALRPLGRTSPAGGLPPPRTPRMVAGLLERTAHALRRHRTVERAARALRISRFDVQRRMRLRKVLRADGAYRYSACPRGRAKAASARNRSRARAAALRMYSGHGPMTSSSEP